MLLRTGYIYDDNGNCREITIEEPEEFWKILCDLELYVFFPLVALIAEGIVLFPISILLWIINRKDNCVVSFLKKHNRKEVVFFDNTSFFTMLKKVAVWWLTFGPIRKTKQYLARKSEEKVRPVVEKNVDLFSKAKDDLDRQMGMNDNWEQS